MPCVGRHFLVTILIKTSHFGALYFYTRLAYKGDSNHSWTALGSTRLANDDSDLHLDLCFIVCSLLKQFSQFACFVIK